MYMNLNSSRAFSQLFIIWPIYYRLAERFFMVLPKINDLIDSQGFYFNLGVQEGVFDT